MAPRASSTPDRGTIRVNLDDTVTFDPDGAFDALEDGDQAQVTFEYALIQAGMSSTAEVSVIVAGATAPPPPNIPPTLTVDARILPPGEFSFAFQTTEPFPEADGVDPADLTLDLDRTVSIEFKAPRRPSPTASAGMSSRAASRSIHNSCSPMSAPSHLGRSWISDRCRPARRSASS